MKTNQIIKFTFWAIASLYLGYAFFNLFLSSFVLVSLIAPFVLMLATGFFLVIRWLGTEDATPTSYANKTNKTKRLKTGIFAADQQHVFRVRRAYTGGQCKISHLSLRNPNNSIVAINARK